MTAIAARKTVFLWLDRMFWLVWALFLTTLWISFQSLYDTSAVRELMRDADPSCLQAIPQFPAFSNLGKTVFLAYLALSFCCYGVLLALAHITIRRCAQGTILLETSLQIFGWMGMIILLWPIVDLALENILPYVLLALGDVKVVVASYIFDIATFGFGLLMLTMKQVLAYAIELKRDSDLTI